MTESDPALSALPIDPTFPPAAYERVSVLLRSGVVGFFVLATVGMVTQLFQDPSQTVGQLTASNPATDYGSVGVYLDQLFHFSGDSVILVGIFLMIAVTVGRVVYAMVDFYRGKERTLAILCGSVVALLLVGLFVVGPMVR